MSDWRRDEDPRERAERAPAKTRLDVIAGRLQLPSVNGSLERRLATLLNTEHNPDVVELVLLRMKYGLGSRFSLQSLRPFTYDDARAEVVRTLPEDSPEAWRWFLWVEHLVLDADPRASLAMYWAGVWTDATVAGDGDEARRAKGKLENLKTDVSMDEVRL